VAMPGMSGLDLQLELARQRHAVPIVFTTAQHDRNLRPKVIARGAVECLYKPFSDTALLEAVNTAIRRPNLDYR
jgi:FixJ family two-component response regulator